MRKKLFRDIRLNLFQFLTIFVMVLLGSLAFAGVHAYMDGMEHSGDIYYEKNNLADLWVSGEGFSEEDLRTVKDLDHVLDAERLLTVTTTWHPEGEEDVTVEANFIESNRICRMYTVDGEDYEPGKDGLWLDSYLAENLDVKVGDEISLVFEGITLREKVRGLVLTPDHVYAVKDSASVFPTHRDFGFAYLDKSEFPTRYVLDKTYENMGLDLLMDGTTDKAGLDLLSFLDDDFSSEDLYVFPTILVDVDEEDSMNEVKKSIEDSVEDVIAVTDRSVHPSVQQYEAEIEEGRTYSVVFTGLFLFIALLSVITTMNRFVRKQRTQIGTLKALGFRNRRISLHYVGYGFFISLAAVILGTIVGALTIGKGFVDMEMDYFEVPEYSIYVKPVVIAAGGVIVLMVSFVTWLSCRKILKESAAQALRIERPNIRMKKKKQKNSRVLRRASLATKWNLRDIPRSKGRTIMALAGILGSMALIVTAFGMSDSMQGYMDWEFNTICDFDYQLVLSDDCSDRQLKRLQADYGDATSESVPIEYERGDSKITTMLMIDDAPEFYRLTGHDLEYIDLRSDGLIVTEKLAASEGWQIGDTVRWHVIGEDEWKESEIAQFNRDPQNQQFYSTRGYAESQGIEYEPDTLYTDADLDGIKELDGVTTISNIEKLKEGVRSMLQMIQSMVYLLITLSAILGFVIIYNMGILSYSEKEYQFATLKVLGFKYKQIKKIFVRQNIWITAAAILLGMPAGYAMTDYIFKAALSDDYDFFAMIHPRTYVYAVAGTFLISYFTNTVLSRKLKKIDMVSSLKANE